MDVILVEVMPLVVGRRTWPSPSEFRRAGHADLEQAIRRSGGHPVWAARCGLPLQRAVGLEVVIEQARAVIARRGWLPGEQKLRQMAMYDLAREVNRYGGARAFCVRFGLRSPPRQDNTLR